MEDLANFTLGDAGGVLEFWKDFDLDNRRLTLDKNCVEMREMKTSSINGRKRLNDATKLYRSKTRDEQAIGMTELLKLYQEEIDQLSRRSKFSESTFYSLYKSIYDAPNPSISIEGLINMVAATSTSQFEIERLKSELAQYDEEFQLLKNQDITIRRLEDQLEEYREQIEEKVMEEVFKRTSEVEAQAESRIGAVREVQRAAEKRLAAVVESMRQAQSSTDRAQTQMFEISTQAEERIGALSAENAMHAEGAERMQERIFELEGEVRILKSSLSLSVVSNSVSPQQVGTGGGSSSDRRGEGGEDCETLQLVITELRQEIRSTEDVLRTQKQRLEGKQRETSQLLSREREALGKVRLELADRPTKDDLYSLRRQMKMLQRVAFNVQEDDEGGDVNTDPENIPLGENMQLEALLTSRMKTLESELTESKRDLQEARRQEGSAKEANATLKATLQASSTLISRLEADVETHLELTRKDRGRGGARSQSRPSDSLELSELLGVDMTTPSSALDEKTLMIDAVDSDNNIDVSMTGLASSNRAKEKDKGKDGGQRQHQQMVDILQAQRDRYKERLAHTESSMVSVQQRLVEIESLKNRSEQDNLALYSKIRYLQSLPGSDGQSQLTQIRGHSGPSPKPMRIKSGGGMDLNYVAGMLGTGRDEETGGASYSKYNKGSGRTGKIPGAYRDGVESMEDENSRDREVESRYGVLYEQRMNPFAEFSQIEKQRRLQELSVADRIVLNTSLAFVSSKSGRTFIVIYLGAMHLLVFFILYFSVHHFGGHGCEVNDPSLHALHRGALIGAHLD